MRLTIINQFYPPDFAPTGRLAASLAEHRASLGDQVTVVTSRGGYVPESPVRPSKRKPNLHVIRLWTPRLGKKTLPARLLDYGSFYLLAALRMAALERQDLVIVLTTPPFIGLAGALHKWLHRGTKLVLWNMDSYPEVPVRAGVLKPDGPTVKLMRRLNQLLFVALDHVVCLDRAMQARLAPLLRPSASNSVIHNWESTADFPAPLDTPPQPAAAEYGLKGRFVILHLGNTGYGHQFDTILDAAELLRDEPVSFLFVGGGQKWKWLERAKEQRRLHNLHLQDYVPRAQVQSILAVAGCALVTLKDEFLGVISPSKIHAYLAAGLPLLYIGPEGGNVDEAITDFGCGISLRHGDVAGTTRQIRRLMRDQAARSKLSNQARAAFESAYSDEVALQNFDRLLDELVRRD